MFELFNEPARRSLFFSRYEASVLGSTSIGTEHLLLGILKERQPLVEHLLGTVNVTGEGLRRLVYERAGTARAPTETSVEIPFSKDAKQVLEYTAEEAHSLLHPEVGTEHLLLGLLRLERGLAWDVLREQGLRLESVRDTLVIHASASSPPPPVIAEMIAAMTRGAGTAQARPGPIYMMTALDGPSPGRRSTSNAAGGGGFASISTAAFSTHADHPPDRIDSIGPISMAGITLAQFALMLEGFLGAPIMAEDNALAGVFDIELHGAYQTHEELIAAVRDQLGLMLTKSS